MKRLSVPARLGMTVVLGAAVAGCARSQASPDVVATADVRDEEASVAVLDVPQVDERPDVDVLEVAEVDEREAAIDEPEVIEVFDDGVEVVEADAPPSLCPRGTSETHGYDYCGCFDGGATVAPCVCCVDGVGGAGRFCPGSSEPETYMRACV